MHISESIITRTWEFGETDLLVSFFTADKGRLKGVAKGARKSSKRFANCLDSFCLTRLEYERKSGRDLYFLNSGKLIEGFSGLRSDFYALSLASYMVELAETLFPLGVAEPRMFDLLKSAFSALSSDLKKEELRILFEAKALALGGYGINFERCCSCGRSYAGEGRAVFKQSKGGIACLKCEKESARLPGIDPDAAKGLDRIQAAPLDNSQEVPLTDAMMEEMKKVLRLHLRYSLGKELKTARYLV
jgi:DNA repair protein RecO (recombination protein O)